MKLLIVLLAVLLGVWLWRSRRPPPPAKPPKSRQAAPLQEMVACQVCGLLLPQDDATTSARGVYCSSAHRQQAER